jgi:anti-sigma-K factor RskA
MSDESKELESLSDPEVDDTLITDAPPEHRRPWGLLIAGLIFLSLWVWREMGIRAMRENARSHEAEINRLTQENETLAQALDRLSAEQSALSSAATTVMMKGQNAAPNASAKIVIEPQLRRAVVMVRNLPRNPAGKSYQLWLTTDAPAPVSGGVFDVSKQGNASVTVANLPTPEPKSYSVTLEPKGGSPAPSGDPYLASQP